MEILSNMRVLVGNAQRRSRAQGSQSNGVTYFFLHFQFVVMACPASKVRASR